MFLLVATAAAVVFTTAVPSSHREAPAITAQPKVDATDFYLFTSYEPGREGFTTMVANYLPLQDPVGGPNYFTLDPEALYEIHIDNDGDAVEDVTFQFQFRQALRDLSVPVGPPGNRKDISVPFVNLGPITAGNQSALNIVERYTLSVVMGDRRSGTVLPVKRLQDGATTFQKPVDNIGTKSLPNYANYASKFIYDIELPDGSVGRMFVGQRKDSFVVNLGETFDLVNLQNPLGPVDGASDDLAGKNITSMILEVPTTFLTGGSQPVIGAWTSASLRQARILNPRPTYDKPQISGGAFTQVSRLGSPLVNEVVIGLPDKDRFNASEPKDDAQFLDYVTHPSLPAILEILFGDAGVQAPTLFPRADLVAAFLTGVDGFNDNGAVGEMLRLNTAIAPTRAAQQSNLGVLGGDLAGFPNGRRPGDDVVDIELRVAMGALLDPALAPSGQLPFTDGAIIDASFFDEAFPYLRTPLPGSPQR